MHGENADGKVAAAQQQQPTATTNNNSNNNSDNDNINNECTHFIFIALAHIEC